MSLRWTRPILAELPESSLPSEFLVARVKGRSMSMIHDWQAYQRNPVRDADPIRQRFPDADHGPAELPWKMFYQELAWMYGRMNPALRTRFAPLLSYWVFQLMVSAIRRLAQGQAAGLYVQTANLVAAPLYQILRHGDNVSAVLEQLQSHGYVKTERRSQLSTMLTTTGYAAVETSLWNALFHSVTPTARGLPGRLLVSLVDLRNLCALHKKQRWQVQSPPLWLAHGRLDNIAPKSRPANGQSQNIKRLLRSAGWQLPEPTPDAGPEQQLLRQLTVQVRAWARENQDEAVLLRYLWERYIETINLALIQRLSLTCPRRLSEELIE